MASGEFDIHGTVDNLHFPYRIFLEEWRFHGQRWTTASNSKIDTP